MVVSYSSEIGISSAGKAERATDGAMRLPVSLATPGSAQPGASEVRVGREPQPGRPCLRPAREYAVWQFAFVRARS
eukprot:11176299-Lingulodinium_polyedra.AAC.1